MKHRSVMPLLAASIIAAAAVTLGTSAPALAQAKTGATIGFVTELSGPASILGEAGLQPPSSRSTRSTPPAACSAASWC